MVTVNELCGDGVQSRLHPRMKNSVLINPEMFFAKGLKKCLDVTKT